MKRFNAAAFAACMSLLLFAHALSRQGGRVDAPPDWENPRVSAIDKEPAHAALHKII